VEEEGEEEAGEEEEEEETKVNARRLRVLDVEAVEEDVGVRSQLQGLQAKLRSNLLPQRNFPLWELLPLNALLNRPLLLPLQPLRFVLQLPGVRLPLRLSPVAFNRFPRPMSLLYSPPPTLPTHADHAGFASPSRVRQRRP
jgi:hypothetical protein